MLAAIRENLRDEDCFVLAAQGYMLHPVSVFVYVFPVSMVLIGLFIPEYTQNGLPTLASNILTSAKVGLFWVVSWFILGRVAYRTMRLGIPFVYAPIGLWVTGIFLSQGLSVLLVPDFDWNSLRTLKQSAVTLPGTLVSVFAAAPMLRAALGHNPDLVPIWCPARFVNVPLLMKLPDPHRTKLRRIHAANQYVEVVTTTGTTLLRMSLTQASALIPPEMGWLCHRSLWVHRDEVATVTFVKGQAQITDKEGRVFPISRSYAPVIKEWLASRQA